MMASTQLLTVDPRARFRLSPYLFMQFMEPLGTTDSSVEAGWDFARQCWREDLVEATRELAPGLIRWGGILTSYYRWHEAVGARARRTPMLNVLWGGVETNQIGAHEFIDFCRQVGADPLIGVNFESDGKAAWSHPANGQVRSAGPEEAADWVDYCNNPSNAERIGNGAAEPFDVRLWQIGNETSYGGDGFDCDTAAQRTRVFASAMRDVDPTIQLIGWGDSGWAPRMLEIAGDQLDFIAFHHHFDSGLPDSPLQWNEWRVDPARTWEHLMHACRSTETCILEMREAIAGAGVGLALTESHFGLPGRNRCDVLATWAAGVANARILNVHARNGDVLKIATLADFCCTRWMNAAVIIPTPNMTPWAPGGNRAYLMPVGRVMSLFRRHGGECALDVMSVPDHLDVTASRTDERIFLHVVNTSRTEWIEAHLQVENAEIVEGTIHEIACDPLAEVDQHDPDRFSPVERRLEVSGLWRFPAASVSAVELRVREGDGAGTVQ